MEKIANYIGGKLVPPLDEKYIQNISPTNGKAYSLVPDSQSNDVETAILSARQAFLSWSKSSVEFRYKWLIKLAEAIDKHSEQLVIAESFDNGKPVWLAKSVDIPRCSANIRFFATSILHFDSKCHNMGDLALNYTLKQPIGVAGCISPWNLPLYLLTWKIAPAIAAGNTVVAKPSELTPYTAYLLSKICIEIGFPSGVINIVHGLGYSAGDAIVQQADIISFTGGTETGRLIAKNAASVFKKCSLELGGKNPSIVFADCNFDLAVETVMKGGFLNQGQICLCGSRVFIENSIYNKFRNAIVKKTNQLLVGDPNKDSSDLGAVISEKQLNKVLFKIKEAEKEGGHVLCGGKRAQLDGELSNGYYLLPTIIENTKYNSTINQEEIFGPVITIMPFKNESDLIMMCNSTKYGLSASIFSNNISKSHRIAAKIDAGVVWINTWLLRDLRIPFGGMKESGLGREGGFHSLNFFTETKNVCLKIEQTKNK